jgi:fructose-1,6-bisphosphatase/inositol monophosphatase family enzyme
MIAGTDLMHRVATIITEVSATAIEPRMFDLEDGEVHSKAPGELVTVADLEAERLLTLRLSEIFDDTPVIGEEACDANPSLLDALCGERAWLVDPLDGTANFVAGSTDWAVMVALVRRGTTACSWIWQPSQRRMYMAERGAGAVCGDRPLRLIATVSEASELTGRVHARFLDDQRRDAISRNREHFGEILEGRGCSGIEYPSLVEREQDFVVWWQTLPWDHAPGVLLAEEAGATVRRLDGSHYEPSQTTAGLFAAADDETWALARLILD